MHGFALVNSRPGPIRIVFFVNFLSLVVHSSGAWPSRRIHSRDSFDSWSVSDSDRNHHIPGVGYFGRAARRLDPGGHVGYNLGDHYTALSLRARPTADRGRGPIEATMNTTQTTAIEPGNRIQLPAEWAEALGLQDQVVLVKTDEGILVRPQPKVTWDDIFASRLSVKPGDSAAPAEVMEVTEDDIVF
jgi:hypothetical protein